VPRLWTETIETHRREVRDAILDTTAALVAQRGLLSVTMSQIAEETGIGRATLYKYFPDVGAILVAWHERLIGQHLHHLGEIRNSTGTPGERLASALEAYALMAHGHPSNSVEVFLHQGDHVTRARAHLSEFIEGLIAEAGQAGDVRADVTPSELASYCLHALQAASALPDEAAVRRLVTVTVSGLRPPAA
jgi:AcrR family transcriptional regulator